MHISESHGGKKREYFHLKSINTKGVVSLQFYQPGISFDYSANVEIIIYRIDNDDFIILIQLIMALVGLKYKIVVLYYTRYR